MKLRRFSDEEGSTSDISEVSPLARELTECLERLGEEAAALELFWGGSFDHVTVEHSA